MKDMVSIIMPSYNTGKYIEDSIRSVLAQTHENWELINILKGDMSIVGPRPQLVRDMVFMTPEQRVRHSVRPGLTGLAQVSGRNNITWEEKFEYDLQYIKGGITLWNDVKIIFMTIGKVFKREDTVREGTVSDLDFGDYLLQKGNITEEAYAKKQTEAKELLGV